MDSPQKRQAIILLSAGSWKNFVMLDLSGKAVTRTAWQQGLARKLRELDMFDRGYGPFERTNTIEIGDPVLDRITRGSMMMDDPIDIFQACYLSKLPEAEITMFSSSTKSFIQYLERE